MVERLGHPLNSSHYDSHKPHAGAASAGYARRTVQRREGRRRTERGDETPEACNKATTQTMYTEPSMKDMKHTKNKGRGGMQYSKHSGKTTEWRQRDSETRRSRKRRRVYYSSSSSCMSARAFPRVGVSTRVKRVGLSRFLRTGGSGREPWRHTWQVVETAVLRNPQELQRHG